MLYIFSRKCKSTCSLANISSAFIIISIPWILSIQQVAPYHSNPKRTPYFPFHLMASVIDVQIS